MAGHNLFKANNGAFAITSERLKQPHILPDIESASEALMLAGVKDEEIDNALTDMANNKTTRAHFDPKGIFLFSDLEESPIKLPPPVPN